MLNPVFKPFIQESPISVMARGLVERVLNPDQINEWFNSTANDQYTRDLLFSLVLDIMPQVVCGSRPSVNAAYQAGKETIGVSVTSVYNKINGIETQTSAGLFRFASEQVCPIISTTAHYLFMVYSLASLRDLYLNVASKCSSVV